MKYQRGVTLTGLVFWLIVISMAALLGMKVTPAVLEYYRVLKDCKATVKQVGQDATVTDVRRVFSNFANIDYLDFDPKNLDISKQGNKVVIEFAYERRIPLFLNASLLLDFKGSTAE